MKKHLLIVDDDVDFCGLLSEYLSAEGFEIAIANGGEDALEHLRSNVADVVILDVMMPAIDGFTLAELIRNRNAEIPIVFLTAKSMTEDVLKGFAVGGDDYIKKPVNEEELVARINALLRRQKMGENRKMLAGSK